MQDQSFFVDSSGIISEIIDGEAIIMDLKTGAYFSADGFGAEVWRGVTLGATREQLSDWAIASYPAQAGVKAAINSFLDQIVENSLAHPSPVDAPPAITLDRVTASYAAPKLSVHRDMEDLITLDPIHDVSETTGWPVRKVD